ncbi:DUF4177 domain-containing protein [Haladaptatus sp. DFWS20]|uniref:DUF4177 domain-containing protein n=1 Tax=Haladaptatus sp. DFWS20 TaxID=3403467 RepID=UPI003EBFE32F
MGTVIQSQGEELMMNQNDRWEYETLRPPRGETKKEAEDPKAELNKLAAEGWRFVETIAYTGGGTKYLVFERPLRENDAERDPP